VRCLPRARGAAILGVHVVLDGPERLESRQPAPQGDGYPATLTIALRGDDVPCGSVHKPLNAEDPCAVSHRSEDVALPNSLLGWHWEKQHMILHALGVAFVIATMWSALQFEGMPPQ
jgi:hypothetical protein